MGQYIYLVTDNSYLELPVACFNTVQEVSDFIGKTIQHVFKQLYNEKNDFGNYKVYRINL